MLISEVIMQIKHYCKGSWMGMQIDEERTRDKILLSLSKAWQI